MTEILRDVVRRNQAGDVVAIPSVCSAHPDVIAASLTMAERLDRAIVIEATSNQVNQDGGYTGMQPADFVAFVHRIAENEGVDRERIVFGGDHLGPQAWRSLQPEAAMAKAKEMVASYVAAGFEKIHLDCSEGCQGEPGQLPDEVTARRSADLARVCQDTAGGSGRLDYVIGTEVPPPGGARADEEGDIAATTPDAAAATITAHRDAFAAQGMEEAFSDVLGLVVQPGVEFSPMAVHHLPLERDPGLKAAVNNAEICLEAHSTDYQRDEAYVRLAELGFAFQKVGPALTFAWREAIYALDGLREIAGAGGRIVLPVMEDLMVSDPGHWQGHYHGSEAEMRLARHVGYADRIRYYWPRPEAKSAVDRLLRGFGDAPLPEPLVLQAFGPDVIEAANGDRRSKALIGAKVQMALRPYWLQSVSSQAT